MRLIWIPALFLTAWLSWPAVASEVSGLLEKMTDADKRLNYQGILVLRKANNLAAMRVEHGADERGIWGKHGIVKRRSTPDRAHQ